jgi:hypothetical protein
MEQSDRVLTRPVACSTLFRGLPQDACIKHRFGGFVTLCDGLPSRGGQMASGIISGGPAARRPGGPGVGVHLPREFQERDRRR